MVLWGRHLQLGDPRTLAAGETKGRGLRVPALSRGAAMSITYQTDIAVDVSFPRSFMPDPVERYVPEFETQTTLRINYTHWPDKEDLRGIHISRIAVVTKTDAAVGREPCSGDVIPDVLQNAIWPEQKFWNEWLPDLVLAYHEQGHGHRIGLESRPQEAVADSPANPLAA